MSRTRCSKTCSRAEAKKVVGTNGDLNAGTAANSKREGTTAEASGRSLEALGIGVRTATSLAYYSKHIEYVPPQYVFRRMPDDRPLASTLTCRPVENIGPRLLHLQTLFIHGLTEPYFTPTRPALLALTVYRLLGRSLQLTWQLRRELSNALRRNIR